MNAYAKEQLVILIVDDNPMNRSLLRDWLEFTYPHCQVIEAENGKAGLLSAQTKPPHLILLDLHMPVMNGYEMALAMQSMATTRTIPMVLCTCEDENNAHVLALRTICHEVLTRPFSFAKLQRTLQQIVLATVPVFGATVAWSA
jgi:CheY-like chemotaxis protein